MMHWTAELVRVSYRLVSRFWSRYRFSTRSLISSLFRRTSCRGNQRSRCRGRSKCTTGSWEQKQKHFPLLSTCLKKKTKNVRLCEPKKKRRWQVLYLQKALNVLQQVEATVAAVVLEGNFAVWALHLIRTKLSWWTATDLPFWLQVAEGQTRVTLRTFINTHMQLQTDTV